MLFQNKKAPTMHPKRRNQKTACSNFLLVCLYYRIFFFFCEQCCQGAYSLFPGSSPSNTCETLKIYMKALEVPVMPCVMLPMWLSKENCCSRFHQYKLDYLDLTEDIFTEIVPLSSVQREERLISVKHRATIHPQKEI